MSERQKITEEMGVHKAWFTEADEVRTFDDWVKFATHLMEDFQHDYGTIVHAISAGALAAAKAMDRHERGGITGFQAGFVMWGFVRHWLHLKDEPHRLVNYHDMLYPQYADKFEKTITPETWAYLQKTASKILTEERGMATGVREHLRSIVRGAAPFGYEVKDR